MSDPGGQGTDVVAGRPEDVAMLELSLERLRRAGELGDLDPRPRRGGDDLLVRAIAEIGRRTGFGVPVLPDGRRSGRDPVADLARACRVTTRRVSLEEEWPHGLISPLLGFRVPVSGEDPLADPVVLVPSPRRGPAEIWDPASERVVPRGETHLAEFAYELYPPLEPSGHLTYGQIARFTFAGARRELVTILAVGLAAGLVGLLSPIAMNHAFGVLVPEGERRLLWLVGAGLVVAALLVWVYTIVQGFAVTRMSLRAEQRLQPAVWARVLSLPASFFRRFQSGELAVRILGVDQLRQVVSTSSVGVVLAAAFSVVNLGVMFAVDPVLGLVGTALLALVLVATVLFSRSLVRETSAIVRQQRVNNANISDILEGLSAIRTAAAELRFFTLHAELIRRQVVLQAEQGRIGIWLQAFYTGVLTGVPAVLLTTIGLWRWDETTGLADVSEATYLAFVTAFNAVLASVVALSALIQPLAVAPETLRAMRPIFETSPTYSEARRDPGTLHGKVELRDVTFRYTQTSRIVLEGCSLVAQPGEFVAIVGPSGAGKSTVLRLLLGFETPLEGSVAFDDHDLGHIDLASVRSQLGVVLQTARPTGGSILNNVIGARPLGADEAWAALEAAGLAADVREMPMGLHTHVAPDGSTLSGGQLQRLMIARALVAEPAILLLDEATSALDEVTESAVSASIAQLGITRIAVAHRLSTIRAADRIYVLHGGSVAEAGNFDELMRRDGIFARLARRQLA